MTQGAAFDGDALRIALLCYRGNQYSGGQGVYTRNLSRELARWATPSKSSPDSLTRGRRRGAAHRDLQPGPVPAAGPVPHAQALRVPRPHRRPGGRDHVDRRLSGAADLLAACPSSPVPAPRRVRRRPRQPVPRLRPARDAPARVPDRGHRPPPDPGGPPAGARRGSVRQAPRLGPPLVRLHPDADAGRPAPPGDHHRLRLLGRRDRPVPRRPAAAHHDDPDRRRHRPVLPGRLGGQGPRPHRHHGLGRRPAQRARAAGRGVRQGPRRARPRRADRVGRPKPGGAVERRSSATASAAAVRFVPRAEPRKNSSNCCAPRRSPACPRSTRASRCPPWRRWRSARRWSPRPAARSPRSRACDGETTLAVPPGDPEALAAALFEAAGRPDLRAVLGAGPGEVHLAGRAAHGRRRAVGEAAAPIRWDDRRDDGVPAPREYG